MTSHDDDADRIALAQSLMVEITARLESLADRAACLQRSNTSDPDLSEDVLAVKDLLEAHRRLAPPRLSRARSRS